MIISDIAYLDRKTESSLIRMQYYSLLITFVGFGEYRKEGRGSIEPSQLEPNLALLVDLYLLVPFKHHHNYQLRSQIGQMLSEAGPGTEAKPSIRKRLNFLFIVPPSLRIELQRIFEVLLIVMVRQQLHLQADSLQDRNIIDCSVLDCLSKEDASGWSIHPCRFQLHPLQVLDLANIGKGHIFLTFYMFVDLLSQLCFYLWMLADVIHEHVGEQTRRIVSCSHEGTEFFDDFILIKRGKIILTIGFQDAHGLEDISIFLQTATLTLHPFHPLSDDALHLVSQHLQSALQLSVLLPQPQVICLLSEQQHKYIC